jgi:hypothetical protein
MPSEEPDPNKYVVGGCLISDDMPDYRCIKCATDFYKDGHIYHNRFVSDGTGILFQCKECKVWFPALESHECEELSDFDDDSESVIPKKFRISHEALAILENTEEWRECLGFTIGFTAESVYGPEGSLGQFWKMSWDTESEIRDDLMQNMGGGIPHWVIDKFIEIILRLAEIEFKDSLKIDPWANY